MLQLGTVQELVIVKKVEFGVYLSEKAESKEKVLLPAKQTPEGAEEGDRLEVFLYRDSKDRPIATTSRPLVTLGKVARLRVAQTGKYGAFLNWGLEKDLFLPFREQTRKVEEGDSFPAALYIDKSGRLCATMKLYHYLETDSPYQKDDKVNGYLYEISEQFGAFVAVDDRYSALIPKREMYGNLKPGAEVSARVVKVHEDGKLDLSIREKAHLQIGEDAGRLVEIMKRCGGAIPFTDKADPGLIREETAMSKNEFKRAVGHLLKEGKIEIGDKSICLIDGESGQR